MSGDQYTYEFDPSGTNPENKITGEQHVLSPPDWMDYYFIIPKLAPFFKEGLKVVHQNTGRTLVEGQDYHLTHRFMDATLGTAKSVFGSITFLDKSLVGAASIEYQTLGGVWTLDEQKIIEILSDTKLNPRITSWEQVAGMPVAFPPVDHDWHLDDLVGMSDVNDSILAINQTLGGQDTVPDVHLNNYSNPHNVTKTQVNLGDVENHPIASQLEAQGGSRNDRYMTPLRTKQLIDETGASAAGAHVTAQDNPHQVDKTQVGLSQVDNFATADNNAGIQGSAENLFMTPAATRSAIDQRVGNTLSEHVGDKTNPHEVDADDVGLGNVQNYGLASRVEAEQGTSNLKYMTPLRTKQLIDVSVGEGLSGHANLSDNPHNVTKTQVNLGNVQNYGVANEAEARTGTATDKYLTVLGVAQLTDELAIKPLSDHVGKSDNPHGVTKAQVKLGSVQNYPIANTAEAQAGTSNERYMTPRRTFELVSQYSVTPLDNHVGKTDNPHSVTKAQVDLGSVENYGVANQTEAEAGVRDDRYMTPLKTAQAISEQVGDLADGHVSRTDNPHGVTKTQISLGNVENYGVANQTEAEAGVRDDRYMTPLITAQAITAQAGAMVSDHANLSNNPHGVTADQVGAYDTAQTDGLLSGKLDVDAQAADSGQLEGRSFTQALTEILVAATKADFGLSEVDNTSDANKPISNSQQAALNTKINISDVVDNLTSLLTDAPLSANQGRLLKGHIDDINALLSSDDTTLDELQEIVNYIKTNRETLDNLSVENITGLQDALDGKVDKVLGMGLSSNDYTTAEKTKLSAIEDDAQKNVATDLGLTGTGNVRTITSSTGTDVTIPLASVTASGLLSLQDKDKINGIEDDAQKNVGTNLSLSGTGNARTIVSSTGNNVSVPTATSTHAGFMSTDQVDALTSVQSQFDTMVSDMTSSFNTAANAL